MFLGVLFAGFLPGFVEQLAEGIAKALAGIKVDRWSRARGGISGGVGTVGCAGVRLRCGGLWSGGGAWFFRGGGWVAELWVVELLFEEVRDGEGLL